MSSDEIMRAIADLDFEPEPSVVLATPGEVMDAVSAQLQQLRDWNAVLADICGRVTLERDAALAEVAMLRAKLAR